VPGGVAQQPDRPEQLSDDEPRNDGDDHERADRDNHVRHVGRGQACDLGAPVDRDDEQAGVRVTCDAYGDGDEPVLRDIGADGAQPDRRVRRDRTEDADELVVRLEPELDRARGEPVRRTVEERDHALVLGEPAALHRVVQEVLGRRELGLGLLRLGTRACDRAQDVDRATQRVVDARVGALRLQRVGRGAGDEDGERGEQEHRRQDPRADGQVRAGAGRRPVRAVAESSSHRSDQNPSSRGGVGITTVQGSRVPDRPAASVVRAASRPSELALGHHRPASTLLVGATADDVGVEVAWSLGVEADVRSDVVRSIHAVAAVTVVVSAPASPSGGAVGVVEGAADGGDNVRDRGGAADGCGSVSGAVVTTSGPPISPLVRGGSANRIDVPSPSSSTAAVPPATMRRFWDMLDSIGGFREMRMNHRYAPFVPGRGRPGQAGWGYSASASSAWIRDTPSTRSSSPSA
jgi:hypothetical protein